LDWIDQSGNSTKKINNNQIEEHLPEHGLLTAAEVARIFKISKTSAYQLIQQNKIQSLRINRNVRGREEDFEKFISQN
jgi:excisionase family DNA binding protein